MAKILTIYQLANNGLPEDWNEVVRFRGVVHATVAFAILTLVGVVYSLALRGMFLLFMFYYVITAVTVMYAMVMIGQRSLLRLKKRLKRQQSEAFRRLRALNPTGFDEQISEINQLREAISEAYKLEQGIFKNLHMQLRFDEVRRLAVELEESLIVLGRHHE